MHWVDDDDGWAAWWWVSTTIAGLLIEQARPGRGPRERAARDCAALLLYQAAVEHRCRPGLVQLGTLDRLVHTPTSPTCCTPQLPTHGTGRHATV